jgi:hypothetical protein
MSENVKVVWPECEVCHGKGIKQVKEGWTVCDHAPTMSETIMDDPRQPGTPRERQTWENVCKTLREQRQPDYGEPLACHMAIAQTWDALMSQHLHATGGNANIDARMVALMLAAMKLVREAYHHKQDNLDDAKVYLGFVEEFSK